jgi:transcriptional regulator with XRE-family HTH domain
VDERDIDAAELGRRLRTRRSLLGRTIASVALDAGLSVPYVANLENGRGNPTLAALRRLAGALGMALGDLLDTAGQPGPAWPAELRRFGQRPRFRRDLRWLAKQLGADEPELRGRMLGAMAAASQALGAGRTLDDGDWQRLLDALVLTLLPGHR